MNNISFCYWLQGYFEIANSPTLSADSVKYIEKQISRLQDPLGDGAFITWLRRVLVFIQQNQYKQEIINLLQKTIITELSYLFKHDIDNSYATTISPADLLKIHNGTLKLEDLK